MHLSQRLMISTGRSVALAAVAAMTFTVTAPLSANAGTSMNSAGHAGATDFSAARRHRHVNRGGGAAAAAAFAGIVGTIGAVAAVQAQRDYYDDGPYAYGGGSYYAEPYYGRRYYGSPYGGYGYQGSGSHLDPGGNILP